MAHPPYMPPIGSWVSFDHFEIRRDGSISGVRLIGRVTDHTTQPLHGVWLCCVRPQGYKHGFWISVRTCRTHVRKVGDAP